MGNLLNDVRFCLRGFALRPLFAVVATLALGLSVNFMSTLAAALAVIATVLAAIGVYGVLSYGVVQRLREIGLRIALGAAPQNVRRMVLKQVGWMAGIGVVIGVSLALLIGQVGRALLYGLSPTDPLVPIAAVCALLTVVLAAAYFPARRAALTDPVTALRGD